MASVFFSYSHKDEALRDELEAHLALLKNQGLIDAWHDRRLIAGDEVDQTIFDQLEEADIVLLLVSSAFLGSQYCYSREMMRAVERHERGEARVIPVILRDCDWHSAPFGKLTAAPRDGKPVTTWPDRDEAFADVARQVRRAVDTSHAGQKATPAARRPTEVPMRTDTAPIPLPRSSNLRLKKEFTEHDRDSFLRSTFDYVCRFFEGSIAAIQERNPGVTGHFERIDLRRMAAMLYRNGAKIAECSIRLDVMGRQGGIAYSNDASTSKGSFNEMLTVEFDEQSLYLKSMGMAWSGGSRDKHLSEAGAAQSLWDMFIERAQT